MAVLGYIWELFATWLGLFAAPAKDLNMLWILVPVYAGWILTEIYQEKKGTHFGNAISNGIIPLWAGVDWGRTTTQQFLDGLISFNLIFVTKIIIVILMIIYGLIIIVLGVKALKITKYIGRIREVTYFIVVLTPVVYGVIQPTKEVAFAVLLFFPFFYGLIELINKITPNPRTYDEELGPSEGSSIPSEFGDDVFGTTGANAPAQDFGNFNQPAPQQFPQQYPRGGLR